MFKHTKGQDKFIKTKEDLLIDLCENCLIEYFADVLSDLENTDKEYGCLMQKQEYILSRYPKLRDIIEDREATKLSREEVKFYIKFLDYKCQSDMIEQKEIFLKGISIAYDLFRKIGIIKEWK